MAFKRSGRSTSRGIRPIGALHWQGCGGVECHHLRQCTAPHEAHGPHTSLHPPDHPPNPRLPHTTPVHPLRRLCPHTPSTPSVAFAPTHPPPPPSPLPPHTLHPLHRLCPHTPSTPSIAFAPTHPPPPPSPLPPHTLHPLHRLCPHTPSTPSIAFAPTHPPPPHHLHVIFVLVPNACFIFFRHLVVRTWIARLQIPTRTALQRTSCHSLAWDRDRGRRTGTGPEQ